MLIGMVLAATKATRTGISSNTTTTTAMMAMRSSLRKLTTESLTTWLWSVMVYMLTSLGRVWRNSSICFFTAAPISVMLRPFFISMLRTRHFLPLLVTKLVGEGYSWRTVAMSFTRTTLPSGLE